MRDLLTARLQALYGWTVAAEEIVFLPGVVCGFNVACRAVAAPGDGILYQTPVYGPFLDIPKNTDLIANTMELTLRPDGRYVVDIEAMAAAVTDRTRAFILCNPHNPVGRVFEPGRAGSHG